MNIVFFETKKYDILSVGKIFSFGDLKSKSIKIDISIIRGLYYVKLLFRQGSAMFLLYYLLNL